MLPLLAQFVAPPIQPGPVRLPGPGQPQRQQIPLEPEPALPPPEEPQPPQPPQQPQPSQPPGEGAPAAPAPRVQGFVPYRPKELARILAPCAAIPDPTARLDACAAALSGRLFNDGYINSRVVPHPSPAPGRLEVVAGRIVEIQVSSSSPSLERRLLRLLRPLQGRVLHLPGLTDALTQLQRLPGVGLLRTNLNRLGEDSTQALLLVTAEPGARPLQGEVSFRNDGNGGSGQFRGLGALVKSGTLTPGDTLLVFGELNGDSTPELGYFSGSLSYTFPLNEALSLTTAFGASRRTLVEAADPFDQLTFRQLQGLGQLDLTLHESIRGRWFGFAGLSVNRSDAFLSDARFPVIPGGGPDAWLRTGFARVGLGYSGLLGPVALGGNVYGLQGIAGLSTEQQREELAFLGIEPGRARAVGAQLAVSWRPHSRWQLDLTAAAQAAFNPLTNPMGFSLGSDNGLKGLPGQLVSGDSGVLGAAELAWSFWRGPRDELQLVPFLGAGNVWTDIPGVTLSDSVGAGGVVLRWLRGPHGLLEVGWVNQFQTGSRPFWGDWLLGNGLYTKIGYRF